MTDTPTKDVLVEVDQVSQHFGEVRALDDVSLKVRRGEFLTLLGPSGCGKTTLLRAIAGFDTPTTGRISIDGIDVTGVAANRRPVNMVFQRSTLFPHLDVSGNVAFGLRLARVPKAEIGERVAEALRLVRLEGYGRRRSHELSGGQQQRVALARALVNRPRVLLLDEPLSALDLRIRLEMELELRRLHRESGATFIYVTHDQREALALSDRIAVLDGGRIEQLGTPGDVYDRPTTPFVARFVGAANVIPADAGDDGLLSIGGVHLPAVMQPGHAAQGPVWLVVRPQVARLEMAEGSQGIPGIVSDVAYRGTGFEYEVEVRGLEAHQKVETAGGAPILAFGDRVTLSWPPALVAVLPRSEKS